MLPSFPFMPEGIVSGQIREKAVPGQPADYPAESADYPAESADYPADMKPRYKQILEAMLKDVWYSTEQIGEMVSLKGSRTRELMKELVDLGYVEITAGTKGRRYKKK